MLAQTSSRFPATEAPPTRLYDVDWLRIIAIIMLILLHTSVLFIPESSPNGQDNPLFTKSVILASQFFAHFVHQWLLPLFFCLSGVGAYFSLRNRGNLTFVWERARRLLVPLMLIFLVVPIRQYPPAVVSGYDGTLLQHIPSTFAEFGQHEPHWYLRYLWFLPYLFIFSVLGIGLINWIRSEAGKQRIGQLVTFANRPGRLFLFALPLVLIEVVFRAQFGTTKNLIDDWASMLSYGLIFVYGLALLSYPGFREAIYKHAWPALGLGMATFAGIIILNMKGVPAEIEPHNDLTAGWYAFCVVRGLNIWFWVVALMGLAQRYLRFNTPLRRYMNEAVLPIYLLHSPLLTYIGFYLIPLPIPPLLNFVLINVLTFIACIVVYEIIVKPFNLTRFFFGMKLKDNRQEAVEKLASAASSSAD